MESLESENTLYNEIRRSFEQVDLAAAELEELTEKISALESDSAEYKSLAERFDKLSAFTKA